MTEALADTAGPIVAVSDFLKAVPDQIARWISQPFIPFGTDGFGLSDTRRALRRPFEVDAADLVVATLYGLAQLGDLKADVVVAAIDRYDIDTEMPNPREA